MTIVEWGNSYTLPRYLVYHMWYTEKERHENIASGLCHCCIRLVQTHGCCTCRPTSTRYKATYECLSTLSKRLRKATCGLYLDLSSGYMYALAPGHCLVATMLLFYPAIVCCPSFILFDCAALFFHIVRPDDPSEPGTDKVHVRATLVLHRRLTFHATRIHTARLLEKAVIIGEPEFRHLLVKKTV